MLTPGGEEVFLLAVQYPGVASERRILKWRDGRVDDCGGLENR
jgi:hypothetical protein